MALADRDTGGKGRRHSKLLNLGEYDVGCCLVTTTWRALKIGSFTHVKDLL